MSGACAGSCSDRSRALSYALPYFWRGMGRRLSLLRTMWASYSCLFHSISPHLHRTQGQSCCTGRRAASRGGNTCRPCSVHSRYFIDDYFMRRFRAVPRRALAAYLDCAWELACIL